MSSLKMIQSLIDKYEIGRLSHAFLVETNNIELCLEDIKQFIKIINCREKYSKDCTKCNLCKLIDLNNLPSLTVIEPDGMSIKKNQLQELQDKYSMKPVYSKYNTYIILNAELMNASSANSILKFLEEPTDHIIGFLVTNNKEKMLDTIISRCQNIKFIYEDKSKSDEKICLLATEYLEQIENDDSFLINKDLILKVLTTRQEINNLFIEILHQLMEKIKANYFPGNNFVDKKLKKCNLQIEIVRKVLVMIKQNVNLELLLDYFVIEMRNLNE